MTDFVGIFAGDVLYVDRYLISTNLSGYAKSFVDSPADAFAEDLAGVKGLGTPADPVAWTTQGEREEICDWFEKIIVIPNTTALGVLLSERQWDIEVWNTHRNEVQSLTALAITGVGGLTLSGPSALTYYPGQSQLYQATLNMDGPVVIANVATWTFTGEPAAAATVTGLRVQVFSPAMDWEERYRETISFKTDLLSGYDESEQRIALRTEPRYNLAFRVVTTAPLDTVQFEVLLYGWQDKVYGVPVWPEKVQIPTALIHGEATAQGDFRFMPSFTEGGLCMVWLDQQRFEAFGVAAVADTAISLSSAALLDWPAGAWLVPLRRGRLSSDQALGRPTNWTTAETFTFTCEAA